MNVDQRTEAFSPLAEVSTSAYGEATNEGHPVKRYLERVRIRDVKELADELHLPVMSLLDASFRLCHQVSEIDAESGGDLPEVVDPKVTLAI